MLEVNPGISLTLGTQSWALPSTSKFRSHVIRTKEIPATLRKRPVVSVLGPRAFSTLVHTMLCLQTACKPGARAELKGETHAAAETVVPIFSLLRQKKIPILPFLLPRKLLFMPLLQDTGTSKVLVARSDRGCALSSSVCTFKKKQVETGLTWIPSMVIACSPAAVATGTPKSSGSLCYLLPQSNRLKFLAEAGLFIKHDPRAAHALHGWAGGAGRRNAG